VTDGTASRTALAAGAVLYRGGPLAAGLVAATGLAAAVLVPVHGWRPVIVFPVLAVLAGVLSWLVLRIPARPEPVWNVLGLLAISAGHGTWAAATHAEHVVLRRDAGSYALFTQWISTRHGLPIPSSLEAFGGSAALTDPAFRLASPAFFSVVHGTPGAAGASADIVPQFLLGAPALFSLGWWTAGWDGLLIMPALLSALAMLALAGLAARLIGARWALLAVAVLAVAQPMLHAARSTYSEPAATILVAAAAALLMDAVRPGSPLRGTSGSSGSSGSTASRAAGGLALASGLAFGLCGLVRVDALREVSLVLPVAAVLALRAHTGASARASASGTSHRPRTLALPLVAGALGGTAVAAIPALLLSRPYLGQLVPSLVPLIGAGVVLGIASLVAVRARGHAAFARLAALVPGRVRRRPALTAAVLVGLTGVVLASRPLWMVVRQSPRDPGSRVVAGLQLRQGLTVDGGRTYAEQSLTWISWYLGPVCIVLAWVTFAVLAHRAVTWWNASRDTPDGDTLDGETQDGGTLDGGEREAVPAWLGPVVIGLGSAVLTLYRPGITPDHPWADRRMVPIVIPVIVLGATAALAGLTRWLRRRSLPLAAVGAGLGAVALLAPAWLATAPVATAATERGELRAVAGVCAQLRPGDAVVAIDNRAANEWPQLIRGVCGYPAASLKIRDLTEAGPALGPILDRIDGAGRTPVLLAAIPEGVAVLRDQGLAPEQVVDLKTTEDQHLLERRPDGEDPLAVQVWLARP
jgi:hypothetical protein